MLTIRQKHAAILARKIDRDASANHTAPNNWIEEIWGSHALRTQEEYKEGKQILAQYTMHMFDQYQALNIAQAKCDELESRGYETTFDFDNFNNKFSVYGFRLREEEPA